MSRRPSKAGAVLRALGPNTRGTAAIEFALVGSFLTVGMLNVFDVASYMYQRMEVENAAQMAAQAVWKACDETELPATTKCADLSSAVANAVQSTSLGTAVSFQSGSPSEGYYCLDTSDTLRFVSSVASRPADCSAVGRADLEPADYIQVQVTYSYTPIFPGITVMSAGPITETTLMRLG